MDVYRRGDHNVGRWVCFELAGQLYGLPIGSVQEVVAEAPIEPVPGTAALVLGVINLRGNVVTVIDLRRRFGLAPQASAQSRIVVVDHGAEAIGLFVDRVADVRKIADGAIKPAPRTGQEAEAAEIRGIVSRGGELLTLLDVPALLTHTPLFA
jgi:purine-binding chemotaxis protein CheW